MTGSIAILLSDVADWVDTTDIGTLMYWVLLINAAVWGFLAIHRNRDRA